MSKSEFLKLWSREAVNQPGIMIETITLSKQPFFDRPVMRETAQA